MIAADKVVPLLDGVKPIGRSEWVARCPAHDDKHPSLAVRQTDDGRLLLHCFAGCAAHDVMAAIGLHVGDLFDAPLAQSISRMRHPFHPASVLKAIATEATIVFVAGRDAMDGRLVQADRDRMGLALGRIRTALLYA